MRAVLSIVVVLWAACAQAATLHVCPTGGDDSRTYLQAQTPPGWATLCRATNGATLCATGSTNAGAAAQTGDTVTVCANSTNSAVGRNARLNPAFNPANDGVTIQCATRGSCTLTLSSAAGPVIGADDRDDIIWDGFSVAGANAPTYSDTGLVDVNASDNTELRYLTLVGDPDYEDPNANGCGGGCGNHGLVRCEDSTNFWLHHSDLGFNPINGVRTTNGASVEVYDCDGIIIEQNDIDEPGAGVYIKGDQAFDGTTTRNVYIRKNLITNVGNVDDAGGTTAGVMLGAPQGVCRVTQNIIQTGRTHIDNVGILVFGQDTNGDHPEVPVDCDLVNNTIDGFGLNFGYESDGGACDVADIFYHNIRAFNNLAINGLHVIGSTNCGSFGVGSAPQTQHEHNVYFGFSGTFTYFAGTSYTFAQWQASPRLQDDVTPDATSTTDPQMASATDYHPLAAFVATQGIDILDLDGDTSTSDAIPAGVYVTGTETIGASASESAPALLPSRPLRRLRRVEWLDVPLWFMAMHATPTHVAMKE